MMTFLEWLLGKYPNSPVNGQWGPLHITVLVLSIGMIVGLYFLLRKRSTRTKRIMVLSMVSVLILFEIVRRVINLYNETIFDLHNVLRILLPRPMCAIAVFVVIIAHFVNKPSVYNFASFTAILATGIFWVYPGAGFRQYILFDDLYSIVTHAFAFMIAISFITLGFTKFEYKTIWKSVIYYVICIVWSLILAFGLKIESDPMYFLPGNEIQHDILGMDYALYLPLYILFTIVFINSFYLIGDRKSVKSALQKLGRNGKKTSKSAT